jgi:heme exporter protein D
MSTAPSSPGPEAPRSAEALRAEHDALGVRLEARASVDAARRGLYQIFAGLICSGLSIALAWDRWGRLKPGAVRKAVHGPPLFLFLAVAATVVLLALAIRSLSRSRRLMHEEDALFARFRELRAKLGLDP